MVEIIKTNPHGDLIETTLTDNTSYTWFAYEDEESVTKERGYGDSPRDPRRIAICGTRGQQACTDQIR